MTVTQQDRFRIRAMRPEDMALAADWAAAEGWNPGDADAQCFATHGQVGRALVRDGRLAAWGVIRRCRSGHKIGPLVADDRAAAEVVFSALLELG